MSQICAVKKGIPTQRKRNSCAKSFVAHVHPVIFCGKMMRAQKRSSGRQRWTVRAGGAVNEWTSSLFSGVTSVCTVIAAQLNKADIKIGITFWLWSFSESCSQPLSGGRGQWIAPCIWWGATYALMGFDVHLHVSPRSFHQWLISKCHHFTCCSKS